MNNSKHDKLSGSVFPNGSPLDDIRSEIKRFQNNSSINHNDEDSNLDWSNLPGCYGTYCGNCDQLTHTALTTPWPLVDSVLDMRYFKGEGYNSLKIAELIINQPAHSGFRHTICSVKGNSEILQLYDINTGTFIDNTVKGLIYTINALGEGIPVVFGVNCQQYNINNDKDGSTNHYIIVVGMGNDGSNYLIGWDIACLLSGGEHNIRPNDYEGISQSNKIYLDSHWPGLLQACNPWPNFYSRVRQPYKVTQILKTFFLQ